MVVGSNFKSKMGPTLSHDLAAVLVYISRGSIIKTTLPYSDRAMNILTDENVLGEFWGSVPFFE